jgi:hypothetical protein
VYSCRPIWFALDEAVLDGAMPPEGAPAQAERARVPNPIAASSSRNVRRGRVFGCGWSTGPPRLTTGDAMALSVVIGEQAAALLQWKW